MITNEMAAWDAAQAATLPERKLTTTARCAYIPAFSAYRKDYRESYKAAMGSVNDSDWNDQLEEGFNKGVTTTSRSFPLAIAGLSAAEAAAHVETTAVFKTRKQSLTQLYDLYIKALATYTKAFDGLYTEAYETLTRGDEE